MNQENNVNNEIQNNNQNMNIPNNNGNNNRTIKTVAIIGTIVLVVILVVIVIFLLVKSMNKNNNTSNDTNDNQVNDNNVDDNIDDDNSIDLSKYNFTDIKTYDVSTNGNIVYNSKEWIDDSAKTDITVTDSCVENDGNKYTFKINNGILTLLDEKTKETYTFKNITNVKSVMEHVAYDCENLNIVLLTNDGKVYYRENYKFTLDFKTIESEFIQVNTNYKFDKIGKSNYPLNSTDVGAHTTDGHEVAISINNNGLVSEPFEDVYDILLYIQRKGLLINYDASLMSDNKYITDDSNNKLYINYGFTSNDKVYIIDRQGYLYTININDKYELETTTADKYSDVKVKSIGIDNTGSHYSSVILQFENSKNIEIDGSIKYGIN